jgi:hypothetical protein
MCTIRPPVSDIGPRDGICVLPGSGRTSNRIGRCGVAEAATVTITEHSKVALAAKLQAEVERVGRVPIWILKVSARCKLYE